MKKIIVLALSVATMVACLAAPAAAAYYRTSYTWMDTYYSGSSRVDKGYATFDRSPARSDPANNPETVTMNTWLRNSNGTKVGNRKTTTFILVNSCINSSYAIDHENGRSVGASCTIGR
ncbi:MAG: hypothetical protein IKT10_03680 [Clostridiales bacterium]|nr:hypothetical protein [Clostridiales bacterium]